MSDPTRYDNIPISDMTRKGMSLNIDDLAAIGRLLSLQDNAYDEQFEKLFESIKELSKEVHELREEVNDLKVKVQEITCAVDSTRADVDRLKQLNSFVYYFFRVTIGVALGYVLVRLTHGPF